MIKWKMQLLYQKSKQTSEKGFKQKKPHLKVYFVLPIFENLWILLYLLFFITLYRCVCFQLWYQGICILWKIKLLFSVFHSSTLRNSNTHIHWFWETVTHICVGVYVGSIYRIYNLHHSTSHCPSRCKIYITDRLRLTHWARPCDMIWQIK